MVINKKLILSITILTVLILAILLITSFPNETYKVDASDIIQRNSIIENVAASEIDQTEIQGLVLMREEEKLARDVYLFLYDKWQLKIFNNIAASEQTHTDAIKDLLERYEISDPIQNDEKGIFQNQELQNLYNELTKKGSTSLVEALIVGATIEDLDIKDLQELKSKTDNQDIILTYENLEKGSRNHLRAFIKQIKSNGEDYTPKYISQEEYNSIIENSQERGMIR